MIQSVTDNLSKKGDVMLTIISKYLTLKEGVNTEGQ